MQEVTENIQQVEEVRLSTTRSPDIQRGDSITISTDVEVSDDYLLDNLKEKRFQADRITIKSREQRTLANYFPG